MAEKVIAYIFLLFCLTYLFFAHELSFGEVGAPKAGFLPIISGIIAVILATAIVITEMGQQKTKEQKKVLWQKFSFILIGLVAYIILLKMAGYLFATFIVTFYFFKITDTSGLIRPFVMSIGTALGFYLLFARFLGISLP